MAGAMQLASPSLPTRLCPYYELDPRVRRHTAQILWMTSDRCIIRSSDQSHTIIT